MKTIMFSDAESLQNAEKTLLHFIPVTEGLEGDNQKNITISRSYRIALKKDEDGRYVVTCPDLKGVVTDGATEDEAVTNAFEAIQAMLESLGHKNEQFILIQI